MSLILEALKKLERDRHTHERGFLVLSQPAWRPAGESHWTRGPALLGVAALGGAAVAAVLLWSPRGGPRPAPAAVTGGAVQAPAAPVQAPAMSSARTATASASTPSADNAPPPRVAWPADPRARAAKAAATLAPPAETRPERASAPLAQPDTAATQAEADGEPALSDAEAPAEEPPVTGPLRLEAIAQRDGQPVAVVSGQLVRVGDVIGASTVVRIGAAEIELETDGVRRILRF